MSDPFLNTPYGLPRSVEEPAFYQQSPNPYPPQDLPETPPTPPEETDISEDIGEDPKITPEKDPIVVILQGTTIDTVQTILEQIRGRIGTETLREQITQPGTHAYILSRHITDHTTEGERIQTAFQDHTDRGGSFDTRYTDPDTGQVILGPRVPKMKTDSSKDLRGKDALIAFKQKAQRSSVRQYPLYNSGFHVGMVSPSMSAISSFIAQMRGDTIEFGRQFGAHFYLFYDMQYKKSVLQLVQSLIIDSTLKDWDRRSTLADRLKLPDLNVLLWAVVSLMYPNGFDQFRFACTNPECDQVDVGTVDLMKFCQHNFSLLNKDAIHHLRSTSMKSGVVTAVDLQTYDTHLGFTETIKRDTYSLVLRVPTLSQYFESGDRFITAIQSSIYRDDRMDLERLSQTYFYRQIAPYIGTIILHGTEGDQMITDPETIEMILDEIQSDDGWDQPLYREIMTFINRSSVTCIGLPVHACPKCGTVPDTPSGYWTVDPLQTFFMMCILRWQN